MKKLFRFLKFFIIFVLIIAAVGVGVYFFFKNYKKQVLDNVNLLDCIESENKQKIPTELTKVENIVLAANATDTRFATIKTTISKLDDIAECLISYYVEDDFKISNEEVSNSAKVFNNSISVCNSMFVEYNKKADFVNSKGESYFNKNHGANDLYAGLSSYIVNYSNFLNVINNNVSVVNKASDAKFAFIDLYTRVAMNEFATFKKGAEFRIIDDGKDIEIMNDILVLENNILEIENKYSHLVNQFVANYDNCNKTELANKLAENVVDSITDKSTAEQKTGYYLKEICGI